jgi:DNA polymerase-3 subunit delta
MAALKGGAAASFLKSPTEEIAAALIYGPDGGLVRERALALARTVTDDLNDPFNAIEFTDQDLKAAPATLADEAAALSFMGGKRLIRLRTTGDVASLAAKHLIDGVDGGHLKSNALVVIEAGDLTKASKLRKMFEAAKYAVSIACYEDRPEDLAALATDMANAAGRRFAPDALEFAVSLLGTDRGISRSELEKLVTYVGPADDPKLAQDISLEDVRLCLIDTIEDAVDDVTAAALDGRYTELSVALKRCASAGAGEITLLRGLQRGMLRINAVQEEISRGASPRDAMKKARPMVFFTEQRAFQQRLQAWSRQKIAAALDLLLEAETAAKTTGVPQRAIAERAAMRLAAMVTRL